MSDQELINKYYDKKNYDIMIYHMINHTFGKNPGLLFKMALYYRELRKNHIMIKYLKKAIESLGKVDLKNLIAQALHMGDEVHNRNRAGTSLLYRTITPANSHPKIILEKD